MRDVEYGMIKNQRGPRTVVLRPQTSRSTVRGPRLLRDWTTSPEQRPSWKGSRITERRGPKARNAAKTATAPKLLTLVYYALHDSVAELVSWRVGS
ncbi:hypothetical protein ABIE67_000250 [Streptomyces sp. V4I8]